MLALAGGADWIPAMAGSLHPPFSLFLPEEKEKTGRARSKREKEVCALRGTWDGRRARGASSGAACLLPAASCGRGLEVIEWTSSSFRCRSLGACARLLLVIALAVPPLIAHRSGRHYKRIPLICGLQECGCLPLAFPLSLHPPRGAERQHAAPPVFEGNQCYKVSGKKTDHRGKWRLKNST